MTPWTIARQAPLSMGFSRQEYWHELPCTQGFFSLVTMLLLFSCSVMSYSATPWTAAYQTSLSVTISQSLLKLKSTESVMSCNHLVLCCPLLLLPSIFHSIRVFPNESAPCIRWPKYWWSLTITEHQVAYDYNRAQKEEERIFLPVKDSANEMPWTLLTVSLPTSFSPL